MAGRTKRYADDYSFGVLQSDFHWNWFLGRCSTLKSDFRYTSNTVFDSFPWPQKPSKRDIEKVCNAAVALRKIRRDLRSRHKLSYRELYRSIELPGEHPLKAAHAGLDSAVRAAYGCSDQEDALSFLLALNGKLADLERKGTAIEGPGLPSSARKWRDDFISKDKISLR